MHSIIAQLNLHPSQKLCQKYVYFIYVNIVHKMLVTYIGYNMFQYYTDLIYQKKKQK